jgi:hypothetical protein
MITDSDQVCMGPRHSASLRPGMTERGAGAGSYRGM